jgi:DNA-directed RNA polymerase specialized sigma24 family protein
MNQQQVPAHAPAAPSAPPRPGALDQAEVSALLAGGGDEVGRAIALIDRHARSRLLRQLRRRFPGLNADDWDDVWAEVQSAAWRAAQEGRLIPDRPLLPWLRQIALSRTIDRLRSRTSHDRALVRLLDHRRAGRSCERPAAEEAGDREAVAALHEAVEELPDRQRATLKAYVEAFPESRCLDTLARAVSAGQRDPISRTSVRRNLAKARRTVRASLLGKGVGPDGAAARAS